MSSFIRQRGTTHTAYWHTIDPATGQRVQHSKGGFRTKKDARAHLHTVMGKVQDGTYKPDSKITVEQLLTEHWLPTKKTEDRAPATIQQYEDIIKHWILHDTIGIGGIRADLLTPKQVTDWRDALAKTTTSSGRAGLAPRSISVSVGVLKSAFRWGAANGLISRDPIATVGRGKARTGVRSMKAWTGEEASAFLKFTADDRRLHPIWQLALVGGLRRGELCGLKWEDIDFDKGTVRIERTRVLVGGKAIDSEPKTKNSRRTLNLAPVLSHLRSLQSLQKEDKLKAPGGSYADDGWVVADGLGTPYHPETLSSWFETAVEECGGLRRISIHGCRHSCATNMLRAGVPIHVVSQFLGHATVAITLSNYAWVLPGQDEAAVVALVAQYS